MSESLRVHLVDQIGSEIRDYIDAEHIDLSDPHVSRVVRMVAGSVLCAGAAAEPDGERVASAMYLVASAWDELVA